MSRLINKPLVVEISSQSNWFFLAIKVEARMLNRSTKFNLTIVQIGILESRFCRDVIQVHTSSKEL